MIAQLTWLEKLSRRRPGHLPDIALTVGQALSHENRDVQERALRLLGRLDAKASLTPEVLAALKEHATAVSPVLHGLVTEALGAMDGEPGTDERDPVHPGVRRAALPRRRRTADPRRARARGGGVGVPGGRR